MCFGVLGMKLAKFGTFGSFHYLIKLSTTNDTNHCEAFFNIVPRTYGIKIEFDSSV